MKTCYSEYAKHAMRFFSKSMMNAHSDCPKFKTDADKKNWYACQGVVSSFSAEDMHLLMLIYSDSENMPEAISRLSREEHKSENYLWYLVGDFERKFAKRRGLI